MLNNVSLYSELIMEQNLVYWEFFCVLSKRPFKSIALEKASYILIIHLSHWGLFDSMYYLHEHLKTDKLKN